MAKSIVVPQKKKPGPRPTGVGLQVSVRVQPPELEAINAWIAKQPKPKPSRPEAIRQLVAKGLGKGR